MYIDYFVLITVYLFIKLMYIGTLLDTLSRAILIGCAVYYAMCTLHAYNLESHSGTVGQLWANHGDLVLNTLEWDAQGAVVMLSADQNDTLDAIFWCLEALYEDPAPVLESQREIPHLWPTGGKDTPTMLCSLQSLWDPDRWPTVLDIDQVIINHFVTGPSHQDLWQAMSDFVRANK